MEHMNIKIIIVAVVILIISLKLYKSKIKGYIGERLVGKKLKKLNKREYKVINNLLLKTTKGSTQIDHIVISKYGVFVIETKNYKGIIKGNEYDDNWNQILINKSETLRNPIKQNNGHIKALKDFTKEDIEKIYNKLNELNVNSFKERKTHVKNVKRNIKQVKKSIRKNICPRCGGKLKKKRGKYGKFKGCKNYPQCTFKVNL